MRQRVCVMWGCVELRVSTLGELCECASVVTRESEESTEGEANWVKYKEPLQKERERGGQH